MLAQVKKHIMDYDEGFAQYLYLVISEMLKRDILPFNVSALKVGHIASFFIYKVCIFNADGSVQGMNMDETIKYFEDNYDEKERYSR